MCTVGVGKGGVFPFGHGGPGEIQPQVIEQTPEYRILQYEGGHKRRINKNPHSIRYFDFPLKTEDDLDRLDLPDMRDPQHYRDIEADAPGSGTRVSSPPAVSRVSSPASTTPSCSMSIRWPT